MPEGEGRQLHLLQPKLHAHGASVQRPRVDEPFRQPNALLQRDKRCAARLLQDPLLRGVLQVSVGLLFMGAVVVNLLIAYECSDTSGRLLEEFKLLVRYETIQRTRDC